MLKKLAVSDGNEDTFRHAHARVTQTINEVKGEISLLNGRLPIMQAPSQSLKKPSQRVRDDAKNNSAMGKSKSKKRKNTSMRTNTNVRVGMHQQSHHGPCYFCMEINRIRRTSSIEDGAGYIPISANHDQRFCTRKGEYDMILAGLHSSSDQSQLKIEGTV